MGQSSYVTSANDKAGTSHTPSSQDEEDGPSSHQATSSRGNASTEPLHGAEKEDISANPKDFLRNLTIIPAQRVDSESLSSEKEWPIDFFRAVLLNLMFSLYRTEETILSKTMLLRSLFMTYLKQLGLFSSAALDIHQQRHCPGTYPPYVAQARDRYKKLAALVFQLDAYLALASGQPPLLHRQEIDVEMASTFGLWNAFGLDVWSKRLSDEPAGRTAFTVAGMTQSPDSFKSSPLLIEDIELGLCGVLQAVWVLAESFPSKSRGYFNTAFQKVLVIDKLDSWKAELDRTNELINAGNITNGAAKYLLLAYRGEDDSAAASLERITTLVRDSMILYYFLKLYTCSSLRISKIGALQKQIEGRPKQARKLSKYEREALVCAIEVLKIIEGCDPSAACFNPLIRHALTAGANMTRELTSRQVCECRTKEGQSGTNMDLQGETEVDGPVVVDSVRVCICNLDVLMARFEKALDSQQAMVE
ncbi:hypothetical protein SLS62_010362 [Diatrype stigma]|uniref:Uncharacterized protein n=1 Tax=Diatrype stigma TaxID=117547 RepID=A0AAN9UBV1_9PEZI